VLVTLALNVCESTRLHDVNSTSSFNTASFWETMLSIPLLITPKLETVEVTRMDTPAIIIMAVKAVATVVD
jgi:hypothetical protein